MQASGTRRFATVFMLVSLLLLAGCETTRYYAQLARGQWEVLHLREPVSDLLADPAGDPRLRERLHYVQQVLEFAESELHLPRGSAYSTYSDLGRGQALWALYAAPPDSVTPLSWCYPIAGCAHYRGYFRRADADRHASRLAADSLDTYVAGVRAYSTLGWFSDPLLNTFVFDDDIDLAALLFHELAHQVVFVAGDTAFNEGFATFVEREGLRRWMARLDRPGALEEYQARVAARDRFVELVSEARARLATLYAGPAGREEKARRKQQLLDRLRAQFHAEQAELPALGRYRGWMDSGLNNAKLATVATYHDLVPAFAALHAVSGPHLPDFFARVREIAELDAKTRNQALKTP